MNCCYEPSWSRKALLLVALVAGSVATQLVPSYEQVAAVQQTKPSVTQPVLPGATRGMTGIDVNTYHLTFVRSIG